MGSSTEKGHTDLAADGRWAAAAPAAPPRREYEPPAIRELKTRLITRSKLEQGYVVLDDSGCPERRDYVVLAYIVKDPDDG